MKKVLLMSLISITMVASGQKFDKVSTPAIMKQYEVAKVELDKLMADPKAQAKADGWFWKTKIYAGFYSDPALRLKYPNSQVIADEAYQKYQSIDPSLKLLKENNGQDALFNLYAPSFNNGIATFNAKNWDSAYYYFSFAVKYSDIIFQHKFSTNQNQAFDTTSILYAGFAAQNSKNAENAVKSYDRLISNKIGGTTYIDIYKFTLVNAINNKNEADFKKYLTFSKDMYPNEDWEDYELSYFRKNFTLAEKASMYEKEDAEGTMSANRYLQYGDIFANIPKEEKETLDSAKQNEYLLKSGDAFKKASLKNPSDGIAAFNAGVIYYNIFSIQDDKVSQAKRALQDLNSNRVIEKDPKKKAASDAKFKVQSDALKNQRIEFEKPMLANADSSIIWLEKAYNILKDKADRNGVDKNCLIKSIDYLSNIYIYKRDKYRGKDLKAFDDNDAKFKFYDALHDKYKN